MNEKKLKIFNKPAAQIMEQFMEYIMLLSTYKKVQLKLYEKAVAGSKEGNLPKGIK